jgi:carbonic anhydrase
MHHLSRQILPAILLAVVFTAALALPTLAQEKEPPWVWNPDNPSGPKGWGQILGPDGKMLYPECSGGPQGQGTEQTPIDITTPELQRLPTIEIKYGKTPLNVLNDYRKIEVRNGNIQNRLVVDGDSFYLVEFHFHTPSEHEVDGKPFAMEAHFVHTNSDGQYAVLGVFFDLGRENPELAKILAFAPRRGRTYKAGFREVEGSTLDPLHLLPRGQEYFHYNPGSLTTPPCYRQIFWFLLKTPATVSQEQVDTFRKILMDVQGFPTNARPLQNLQDRKILENRGGRVIFRRIRGTAEGGTVEKIIGIGGIRIKKSR